MVHALAPDDRTYKILGHAADQSLARGLTGPASSRGAQLFGEARVLAPEHPERARYWEAFRWENEHAERGRPISEPPRDILVVIEPTRIVHTEHWRRRERFAARQFWRRTPDD